MLSCSLLRRNILFHLSQESQFNFVCFYHSQNLRDSTTIRKDYYLADDTTPRDTTNPMNNISVSLNLQSYLSEPFKGTITIRRVLCFSLLLAEPSLNLLDLLGSNSRYVEEFEELGVCGRGAYGNVYKVLTIIPIYNLHAYNYHITQANSLLLLVDLFFDY